jgi:hypothetical protein
MGMGIVSDAEFDSELANGKARKREESNPTPDELTISDLARGRSEHDINVPDALRKIIGDTATSNGRQEAVELARNFGISGSSASAYAVGARSTSSYDNRPSLPIINKARLRIQTRATKKLHLAFNALTPEKIGEAKANEIALVAKAMSAIIKDMEPVPDKSGEEVKNVGPTFVFMAPPIVKEEVFDVKYVRE